MSTESHLALTGLTCPACVRRVDQKLRALAGVTDVRIDLASGQAVVLHETEAPSVADLVRAVERAGYGASPTNGATS